MGLAVLFVNVGMFKFLYVKLLNKRVFILVRKMGELGGLAFKVISFDYW